MVTGEILRAAAFIILCPAIYETLYYRLALATSLQPFFHRYRFPLPPTMKPVKERLLRLSVAHYHK